MDWTIIIAIIQAIVDNCAKRKTKNLVRELRNPSPMARARLMRAIRREVRREGIHRWRDVRQDYIRRVEQMLRDASDSDLREIVLDAKTQANDFDSFGLQ